MTDTTPDHSALIDALIAVLGPVAVLSGADTPPRSRNDCSGLPPTTPMAVVRPLDAAGVSATLRLCAAHGVAVVPQGGMTGLCGGARPLGGEVALSLERMVGVEEIDSAAATMTVRAGTPLEAVQQAALDAGFFFPLDLGARGSCSVGGNLATNAGGNRVIRYGMAREMVLGLEVVLPDGTVITSLNKMIKNNAGLDLKHLFIGSEGTLGVITRVVLRLSPKPASAQVALCAVHSYADVLTLLASARQHLGPQLSAFEVMWPEFWRFANTHAPGARNPFADDPTAYGAHVLVEALGTDEAHDAERFQAWLGQLLDDGVVPNAALAQSLADAKAFWALRDASGEFQPLWPAHLAYDVGLPVTRMEAYIIRCRAALAEAYPGMDSFYYGHIGDGNLHIIAHLPDACSQPKDGVNGIIYGLVREFGGTVSAEHGIGTLKRPWLGHARTPQEIGLMRLIKAAIDPAGLLNPGKVL